MPGSLDNLEEAIRKLQDMYDDPDIVIPASQLPEKPNPYKDFMDRNPQNKADGGRIGFYKGMSANKAKKKIKLKEPATLTGMAGDRKLSKKQIDALDPNYLGDFTGGDLERPKKVYKSGTSNSVIDDAIEIRNIIVNNKGNIFGLEELGEKAQIYTSGTGTRKSGKGNRPDIRRVRAALALAKDNFPEIGNFKFVTDRYKIDGSQRQQLNMVVDTIKAYQSATGDEKLAQFLPDNMGQFYTRVIEKGPKKLPGKPEQGLYIKMYNFGPEQIKYISDRITDETGQKFTSKDYKNLITDVKKYRASVSGDARTQTRLANINKQIKNLADDSVIQNLLKGDLNRKTQEALLERATRLVGGDASIASRRLFMMAEAMSDTTNKYKNLGIELNSEKANKIISTGKEIGGRNNRYGMSSVLYDYYGNVVDKAIGSGEGQTFLGKYQQAIRNALDKGQSPDEIFSLTASARTRVPGQGNLAPYALFTQQLKTEVNSAIKGAYIDSALSRTHGKLQEIFKGRKYSELNAADKKAANALVEAFEKEKTRALNQPVNPGEVKKGAKPIYLTAAEKKNIQLPSFDLKNPPSKSIEGFATRFVKYPQIKEAFEKSYKDVGYSMKVTKDMKTQKEFLESTLASLGDGNCAVTFGKNKRDGGRIGYQTGTPGLNQCIESGIKNINEGKFKTADQAQDAARLLGGGKNVLRGLMKYGILPEAAYVAGESVFRSVLGEEPLNALKKSIDTFSFGLTDFTSGIEAEKFGKDADRKLAVDKFRASQDKVNSIQQDIANLETLNTGSEFGYEGDQTKAIQMKNVELEAAKKELQKNYVNPDTVQYIDRKGENIADAQMAKSGFAKASLKDQMEGIPGVAGYMDTETARVFQRQPSQMELNLNMLPSFKDYQKSDAGIMDKVIMNAPDEVLLDISPSALEMKKVLQEQYKMENLKNTFGAEQMYGTQGIFSQPLAGGGIAKLAGVDDGPPPVSGPNPQGLQGLLNRVKKQ